MSEQSFVMLKPGVLNRRLVGEVISRLERKGLRLVGVKMLRMSRQLAETHYREHLGRDYYEILISYTISGPVVAMVWEADNCVALVRRLAGSTNVLESVPGTIRGDYCLHTPRNIIHASDSVESAKREIGLFFKPEELVDWQEDSAQWL